MLLKIQLIEIEDIFEQILTNYRYIVQHIEKY